MAQSPSVKKLMINKANSQIVIATSIASVIIVFSLVASYMLFGQLAYQNKVLGKKKQAITTLKADIQAVNSLKDAYSTFTTTSPNIIGGSTINVGDKDGDNAKIVLDALPSNYDYPALATSIEKLVTSQGAAIESINGIDDQVAQSGQEGSSTPLPVDMPIDVTVKGSYQSVQNVLNALDKSIRPFQILSVQFTADKDSVTALIKAKTYYQPEKLLQIRQEVVK